MRRVFFQLSLLWIIGFIQNAQAQDMQGYYNVRDFGAVGDGITRDTDAINAAIIAASRDGGGTVYFPPGTYASFSVELKSQVDMHLANGATLLAATPQDESEGYLKPEPNIWGEKYKYQDFGHSHFRNSLLWGENIHDVTISGSGLIDGKGLWKGLYPPLGPAPSVNPGNKAIAIKGGRNITFRDFSIYRGGHFGILATAINNLTIDNLRIDTNRDGIDIDVCKNVRISNVVVNSPNDDAIVLKSSYVTGKAITTENVTISNSIVSGYAMGTVLDGTYQPMKGIAPDGDGATGRIKLGTESNGGFKRITITNVVFDHSRGLALETVDGGIIEDVVASGLVMNRVSNSPIFIYNGARMRGPENTPPGAIRRVLIKDVTVSHADGRFPVIIQGLPESPVSQVTLKDMYLIAGGGLTQQDVLIQKPDHISAFFALKEEEPRHSPFDVPDRREAYPEPAMFGLLPASGLYMRYAQDITLENINLQLEAPDTRSVLVFDSVNDITLRNMSLPGRAQKDQITVIESRDIRLSSHGQKLETLSADSATGFSGF